MTKTVTPGRTVYTGYDIGGNAIRRWDGLGHEVTATTEAYTNHSVPSRLTANGAYEDTVGYTSWLAFASHQTPNLAMRQMTYGTRHVRLLRRRRRGAHQHNIRIRTSSDEGLVLGCDGQRQPHGEIQIRCIVDSQTMAPREVKKA